MRAYIAVFLCASWLPTFSAAQSASPAELPPEGYSGRAFVDSGGCAFTRAKVNDVVVWVARRDASRVQVCDEVPTFATAQSERIVVSSPVPVSVQSQQPRVIAKRASTSNAAPLMRPVWDDGRHNPNRGPRTAEGDAAMLSVWTNDVPMVRR